MTEIEKMQNILFFNCYKVKKCECSKCCLNDKNKEICKYREKGGIVFEKLDENLLKEATAKIINEERKGKSYKEYIDLDYLHKRMEVYLSCERLMLSALTDDIGLIEYSLEEVENDLNKLKELKEDVE